MSGLAYKCKYLVFLKPQVLLSWNKTALQVIYISAFHCYLWIQDSTDPGLTTGLFLKFSRGFVILKFYRYQSERNSWELVLTLTSFHKIRVYPRRMAGIIPSQLSNVASRSRQTSEPNTLPHISSTLDPHLEIQHQFLKLSLKYFLFSFALLSTFSLELIFSPSASFCT